MPGPQFFQLFSEVFDMKLPILEVPYQEVAGTCINTPGVRREGMVIRWGGNKELVIFKASFPKTTRNI